ncbi:MAG TPA: hypothetical protein PLG73_02755, partial [Candidatus Sumerlaeota bacterium]|nr:hypothetical protein [Candidatus Sumerlaeota bacterium]
TEFLRVKIDLNKELELAGLLTDPTLITQNETLADETQWSDPDSDPLAAVEAAKATVMAAVQALPNVLVLPYPVYAQLRLHPKVVERVVHGSVGAVDAELLAQIFDVERVLVARAFRNTAAPGQPPEMRYVWGNDALLAYVPARPALKQVALAYTFAWTGAPGALSGHRVELWREEKRKADVVRVQRYYDQRVIAPDAAFLWKEAVA